MILRTKQHRSQLFIDENGIEFIVLDDNIYYDDINANFISDEQYDGEKEFSIIDDAYISVILDEHGSSVKIDKSGIIKYSKNGLLDRSFGPAYISTNEKRWYKKGKMHRDDGPAVLHINIDDGSLISFSWYLEGKFLGYEREGFFKFFSKLDEEKKVNKNILKYLAKYL